MDLPEVNRIYQFCKGFDQEFRNEIKHLLEYKIQLTDRTTVYVDDYRQKAYECHFTFLAEQRKQHRLTHLTEKIKEIQCLQTIDIKIDWKVIRDATFLTEEEFEKLCPVAEDGVGRTSTCDECK